MIYVPESIALRVGGVMSISLSLAFLRAGNEECLVSILDDLELLALLPESERRSPVHAEPTTSWLAKMHEMRS